ncbi:hypothetical protein KH5H1_69490 [Corallococcus caeni]|nr:hypothetical protein KH5H1_69490 [Corallococcus sp. KH5-1]
MEGSRAMKLSRFVHPMDGNAGPQLRQGARPRIQRTPGPAHAADQITRVPEPTRQGLLRDAEVLLKRLHPDGLKTLDGFQELSDGRCGHG